jgi:NAD(P)H-hydrate epimerase
MRRIDDMAIRQSGIPRLVLMEHAGLAVARVTRRWIGPPPQRVTICCGLGYNGGDGLCAARHLSQWGYPVRVLLMGRTTELREEPAIYARMLEWLRVPITEVGGRRTAWRHGSRAVIDALLGIGLHGRLRPLYASVIARINRMRIPVIAVDIPSGLDADTGRPCGAAVRADVTVTFGRPKRGLLLAQGPAHAGRLVVDTITFPTQLLRIR